MKFSIIIPHFNRPDLIIKTIKSFNDLNNKEIIIVDDISTKENIQKLENNLRLIDKDKKIKLIKSSKKLFLPGARNLGLKHATGEWIFFIDDDDEATPGFIKWLNKDKLNKKYDFYRFPNIEKIDGKIKMFIFKWWHKKYSAQVSTYLFNVNFLKLNDLCFNEKILYGEDFEFMVQIFNIKKIKSKYIHHFSIYYHRFSNINSMIRSKEENPLNKLKAINIILDSNYEDKYSYALSFLVGDYYFSYKNNCYSNKQETYKIYLDFYNKINPKFRNWWNIYLPWKINYFKFKKYIKKNKKYYN